MILRSADATAVCNFPPQVCVDIVPFSSHSVSVGGHGTGPVPLRLLRRCSELNSRIATAVNYYTQLRPGALLAAVLELCGWFLLLIKTPEYLLFCTNCKMLRSTFQNGVVNKLNPVKETSHTNKKRKKPWKQQVPHSYRVYNSLDPIPQGYHKRFNNPHLGKKLLNPFNPLRIASPICYRYR